MRSMPYLVRHPSGVYYAQRKVPERLQAAVPRVLKNGKRRQVFLTLVAERRRESADAWLFPLVSPEKGRAGVKAWSKWWVAICENEWV
jgi:hypothetical protein